MDWLVKTRRLRFGANSLNDLLGVVREDDASTEIIPVEGLSTVLIDPSVGTTVAHGLRYNSEAFRAVCTAVGGGLMGVLSLAWKTSQKPAAFRQLVLIKVFNNVVRLQENDGLGGLQLVVNTRSREIVGVTSRRYQRVSNFLLLQHMWQGLAGKYRMISGFLDNRDISIVFQRVGVVSRASDAAWSQGLAVYNSETTSSAVFMPQAVFDSVTQTYSLTPESPSNRLVHRRTKSFYSKLDAVVQGAMQHPIIIDDVAADIAWRSKSLGDVKTATRRVKQDLAYRGFNAAIVDRVDQLIKQQPVVTRFGVYQAVLNVARDVGGSSRPLRVYAAKLLLRSKGNE